MSNAGTSTALQLRLDATQIIENVELFLRGAKQVARQDESGKIITQTIPIGKARANPAGIQAILNHVSGVVNSQVVQGNFRTDGTGHSEQYEDYIVRLQINLAVNLMNNLTNWEIVEDDYDIIIDFIMDLVEPFMTRLIDNKERESYENQIPHRESHVIGQPNKGTIPTF